MRPRAAAAILLVLLSCASPARRRTGGTRDASPDLEPFLRSYFATWSAGDMEGYKEHFHPKAVITFVKDGKVVSSLRRDVFVARQAAVLASKEVKPVERMTSFTADEDDQAATVVARWELTRGGAGEVERGVDRFTLIRDARGRWRIAALVFYATE